MKDNFQIKLSAKEILVIAAMLGFESIFGIDDSAFLTSGTEMKGQIKQIVQRLERKKLIRYDLDGTLYIVPTLRKSIECICSAETVGFFSTNLKSGKRATIYVLGKDSVVTTLEHIGGGKYSICLSNAIPLTRIIPSEILNTQPFSMSEILLFEEAQFVQRQIESFDNAEAEKRIQKYARDTNSVKAISQALSRNCGYMSLHIYCKNKNLYDEVFSRLLVTVDNHTMSLLMDENDVLHFDAICSDDIIKHIISYLSVERGAQ